MHPIWTGDLLTWDDPEGGDGEGGGRGGSGWGTHVNPWLFMSMNGKNHYNIVK